MKSSALQDRVRCARCKPSGVLGALPNVIQFHAFRLNRHRLSLSSGEKNGRWERGPKGGLQGGYQFQADRNIEARNQQGEDPCKQLLGVSRRQMTFGDSFCQRLDIRLEWSVNGRDRGPSAARVKRCDAPENRDVRDRR